MNGAPCWYKGIRKKVNYPLFYLHCGMGTYFVTVGLPVLVEK